ncbi:putative uncharacterized protein DDB_G0271606 [Sorghum bicolor]|uniref:putative uncharacterized protein DDB_G0271606 n=1 Tax=Sorghum bicolor TaxID=4558 RepID=UPI000B42538F|nr:putative uncharacterized protein DDB_G0271606 [Sorghum bicolor]|eukprot:XP_021321306.1 putative uncharacterized protein DDB_G0271606 [Sorghum bicolor]
MIEDLRVKKTELARSYKEIERANTDLVGENTTLEEKIHGLKDDLLAAQVDVQSWKAQLEGEVTLTGRLRTAINNLSTSWELEPANEAGEAARGDALGTIDARSSRPPVEDDAERKKRRASTEKHKSAKDAEKKKEKKKNLERQALEERRAKSRHEWVVLPVGLKRPLEQAQPSMAKRLKVGASSKDLGSPDPRPPTGDDKTPPRLSEGGGGSGSVLPSPGQGETTHLQGQEGAPEPPKSGERWQQQQEQEAQVQQQQEAQVQLEEQLEQHRQQELPELQLQQQLEELLEQQ